MLLLAFTTAATCFLSLLVNRWAETGLTSPLPIWNDVLTLQLVHNPGIAFSVELHWLELPIILGALSVVTILAISHGNQTWWMRCAFGSILGGAVANVIDRWPDGLVTDYVSVGSFPVFNLADSWITIGVALLILEQLLHRHDRRQQPQNEVR